MSDGGALTSGPDRFPEDNKQNRKESSEVVLIADANRLWRQSRVITRTETSFREPETSDCEWEMNTKPPKQLRQFAKAVADGDTLQSAMISAGYSESTAKRGKASLSKPMLAALAKQGAQLEYLGGLVSPERQEKIVRGRLLLNTFHGKDKAVQSARLLGSDRRVSMWKDDAVTGVIMLQMPVSLASEKSALPVLEGEAIESGTESL